MRNIKLVFSYDGGGFQGWQVQPGRRTVQETIGLAIGKITGEGRVAVNASGRTDAGVHALGQVANFKTENHLPAETLMRAINANLPDDIVVLQAEEADANFNANRDAVRKLYRYVIHDGKVPSPFLRRYAWQCRYPLDAGRMRRAAQALLGTHDFRSFETEWPNRASSVRTITHVSLNRFGDYLWFDVEADGFLYNMVRTIVGTLMNVGRGFWDEDAVARIIAAQDRTQAGPTAPPEGLFLVRVDYLKSNDERVKSNDER